jgi:6-phosphogluconolactonase
MDPIVPDGQDDAVRTDGGLLWICSYSRADGPGPDPGQLSVWERSGSDGCRRLAALDLFPSPSYGEFSADGTLLYLVGEGLPGTVVTVDTAALLAGAGQAAVLDSRGSGGDEACQLSLSPSGRRLAVANYCSAATPTAGGVVSVFTLTDRGVPDGPAKRLELSGSGPDPDRQPGPHAHQVTWITEDELLVVDLGDDSLVAVTVGPDGQPTVTGRAAVVPGSGPRHLAQVPATGSVPTGIVLDEELSGQVSWWEPDEHGLLVQRARIPVMAQVPDGRACDPSGIKLSADHRLAYVAVRGVDVVSTVAIDPAGVEPLRLLGTTPTGGAWPRDLLVDDDTVWVANQGSSTVTGLAIDPATGIPGDVHTTLDVPFPTWLARRQL